MKQEDDTETPRIRLFLDLSVPFTGLSPNEIFEHYRYPWNTILYIVKQV